MMRIPIGKTIRQSFLLLVVLGPADAWAQEQRETNVLFYTENDDWPPDTGTDKNYTNGFRLTIDRNFDMFGLGTRFPFLQRWLRDDCSKGVGGDAPCQSTAFHFGQQFYTPDDISDPNILPWDRPYAGWLYVGASWRAASTQKLTNTDVYVGFTGKWSFAEQVQSQWHEWVGAQDPKGWDHQIGTRLGVIVTRSYRYAVDGKIKGRRVVELSPYYGGNFGNIITDAYVGGRIKLGLNITRDWAHGIGPVLVSSNQPMNAIDVERERDRPFEFYFVGDLQGRGLLYNAFIDAAPDHELSRRFLVGDGGIGAAIRICWLTISYRKAFVSREFDEGSRHDFKALRFTVRLNPH